MVDHGRIDQFLGSWQSINRRLKKGKLAEGETTITRLQWMLLRHVSRHEECTMGMLAEKFGVRPSTVSQMTDRLEKAGWAVRVSATRDARLKVVHLTERGQDLIQNVESRWAERLTTSLNEFSESEQETLIELLGRLAVSLEEREAQMTSE